MENSLYIGSGQELSIRQLAELIADVEGFRRILGYNKPTARRENSWTARVSLRSGGNRQSNFVKGLTLIPRVFDYHGGKSMRKENKPMKKAGMSS
jgi:hypothetical protein